MLAAYSRTTRTFTALAVAALCAGAVAARAADCTLIDASDRSVLADDFFRVRLRFQCDKLPKESDLRRLIDGEVSKRLERRQVHVVEVWAHGPGQPNLAAPDGYALWAYKSDASRRPPTGASPGSYATTIAIGGEALTAAMRSALDPQSVSEVTQSGATPSEVTLSGASTIPLDASAPEPDSVPAPTMTPEPQATAFATELVTPDPTPAPPDPSLIAAAIAADTERTLAEAEINVLLSRWLDAWQALDLDRYIECYTSDFRSGDETLADWRERKRGVFARAGKVKVEISDIDIGVDGDRAVVSFIQNYRSESVKDRGLKTLILKKEGEQFRIAREDWSAL